MKLLALDGNSIVNRAFYGIKLLTTKDGRFTNGIYGFITILTRLVELETPDGIAVAFDLRSPTFRHRMYDGYKAGRKGMPDELAEQLPVLKKILTLMGVHCIECEGYEADDILGTLAAAAQESGDTCVISTGDRDSFQLVSDEVRVLLAATKMGRSEIVEYTPEKIKEKYGVTPPQMIDIKALMGDSSDNIPGVAGVGEKTATDLIVRFHDIDNIYENIDTIDVKEGVRRKLKNGRESAYLSRELGTICKTVPISRNLSDYKTVKRQDAELARLFADLEFYKFIEKFGLDAIELPEKSDGTARRISLCGSMDDFTKKAEENRLVDLSFGGDESLIGAVSADAAFIFDMSSFETIAALKRIIENGDIAKRVPSAKQLYHRCAGLGIEPAGVSFDTSLAGYLLNPSSSDYDTERLFSEYGGSVDVDEKILPFARHSAVCDTLAPLLEAQGLLTLYRDIELPLARVLADMERWGFLVDTGGIAEYGNALGMRINELEREIYSLVGYEFNLNSPKQLGEALFVKLGLPAKKKTKSGYSTGAEVLEDLKYAHPAVSLLLEYRQLAKLKSTYCDALPAVADRVGRIHSTLSQTETRTGRISSADPNLQNIPVRQAEGRELRKFFKASDGYVLCDADYSQIELRVLAHMSKDKAMCDAFLNNEDIHRITASQVFGVPLDMVTPRMRSRAKAVNFGIVYGIGAFSLAKDIGVSRKEADEYIKGYFATYPKVEEFMKAAVEKAKHQGYSVTLYGRRRYLPELASSNANLRSFGERVARNMPVQGTAADIIKLAMLRVFERINRENLDARLILQVHDELIVEAKEDIADYICTLLEEEMSAAAQLAVPLPVEAHSGKNWFEAKE